MNEFFLSVPLFGLTISLLVYWGISIIAKRVKHPVFNVLVITAALIIAFLTMLRIEYETYMKSASALSMMLSPATVALAIPLYKQLKILKQNWLTILVSVLAGVLSSVFGVLALHFLFQFSPEIYASLLPKSTTLAIGMPIAEINGGYIAVATVAITITGNMGGILAPFLAKTFRITDPVAQGIATGTATHMIGTAAVTKLGEVQGAMSSLSLIIAALMTAFIVPLMMQLVG